MIQEKALSLVTPLRRGIASGLGAVSFVTLCLWPSISVFTDRPSGELLRYVAAIGATFLVAYAIESTALARLPRSHGRESVVGTTVSVGMCGLFGIVVALALAERASVAHWTPLDDLAFAFAAASLLLLGIWVILQPLLTYELQGAEHVNHDDD